MPTIKELADAEAERAEAEHPDDDDQADAEREHEHDDDDQGDAAKTAPPAEPDPLPDQPSVDAAVRSVEQAADDYTAHVHAVQELTPLGLVECPLCPVAGFVPDVPQADVDPLRRQAVLAAMGDEVPPDKPHHPNYHRCDGCDGWGMLPTDSRRVEFAEEACPKCQGQGRVDRTVEEAQRIAQAADQPAGLGTIPVPAPTGPPMPGATLVTQGGYSFPYVPGGAPDQIGRLAGHPLWGQAAEAGGL